MPFVGIGAVKYIYGEYLLDKKIEDRYNIDNKQKRNWGNENSFDNRRLSRNR